MVTEPAIRRVVTYERVSSEDQREQGTIKTQTEELARRLAADPQVRFVERYPDDGVSGTIPFSKRPGGRRLMEDARRGLFDEVWVYKIDRLGRDDVDPLIVWKELEALGIKVHSVTEGVSDPFVYAIHVAVAAEERRKFLERSRAGLHRAVSEGRYVGGIAPLGYRVEGVKSQARLVPDETIMWGDFSAAEVVMMIFEKVAIQGYSTYRLSEEMNRLGIPTAYRKDGRGVRGERTGGCWWPGRILQILKTTTYYGEYHYGKRSKLVGREVLIGTVPAIVSKELWDAAREALALHKRIPPESRRRYSLRSLITCGICGLKYSGTSSKGRVWYRCNGQLMGRGKLRGRCTAKGIAGDLIEAAVKADIEQWLRSPTDLIAQLEEELAANRDGATASNEAERITLEAAMQSMKDRKDRILDLYIDGRWSREELDRRLTKLEAEHCELEARLQGIVSVEPHDIPSPVDPELWERLCKRLDDGLPEEDWHRVITLLVGGITVQTEILHPLQKNAKAMIEYRFPDVVRTSTDIREGQNYTRARRVVRL